MTLATVDDPRGGRTRPSTFLLPPREVHRVSEDRSTSQWIVRASIAGLLVVLCFLAGFSIFTQERTAEHSKRAGQANRLSDTYQDARFWVSQEESLERKYRLEPTAEVLALHKDAERNLASDLRRLGVVDPSPATAAVVARLTRLGASYDKATVGMFRAVDARDAKRIIHFDHAIVDPVFGAIEGVVYDRAKVASRAALAESAALRQDDAAATRATSTAFAVGLLLLAGFGLIITRFRRRLDAAHSAEIKRLDVLAQQRQQLEEAQAVGGFGSWEWDTVAGTVEWSEQLYRIYGREPQAKPLCLQDTLDASHPGDRDRLRAELQATRVDGGELATHSRIVRPDGSERVVELRGKVAASGDRHLRIVGTAQDITERFAAERAKDEFVAIVSHELRTPLTSIRGSLGLLESGLLGPLPENGQRMVEIAVKNSDRLVRLINDILDIERIESGQMELHQSSCEVAGLIERAVAELRPMADAAGVALEIGGERAVVLADADRVHQILTNLVSNAIKFSAPGTTVSVDAERVGADVEFRVRDEGRGIPPEHLESIFGRFQQVDSTDAREKGGTGLGLAICRTIVERHNGLISAHSTVGEGSTFVFTLPAQRAIAACTSEDELTVLVCDDDDGIVEVVREILGRRGYRVLAASGGAAAVELAVSQQPDAILLDLLMPGLSGWETALALKQRSETKAIPIVILSVLAEAEAEAVDGQVIEWLQKPVDDEQLCVALEHAVASREEPFKVLVVEDDEDLSSVLTATFRRHGILTFQATDGAEALELAERVLPDLVILDLGLPEVDGFEVVEGLRHTERLRSVPIVVYTARDLDDDNRRRLRSGATTEVLTKGRITPSDFERRVVDLLSHMTPDDRTEHGDGSQAHPVGR